MNQQIQVRMDRGDVYQTVHGERGPDDRHATTHYYQDGLPFDGEGHLIVDHADFENDKGQNCSRKAAELRAKAHALIVQAEKKERKRLARQAEEDARNPRRRGQPARVAPTPVRERFVVPPPLVSTTPQPDVPPSIGTVETSQSPGNTFDAPEIEETGFVAADEDEEEGDDAGFQHSDADLDDDDDDDDAAGNADGFVKVNMEAFLRGEEDVPWHVLTQEIAARYKRRVPNMREAIIFMIEEEDGPKVIPKAQLAPKFLKHLA